jgi:hypothetical protein
MPTATQYEIVKHQVKSFEPMGFHVSLDIQSMKKDTAPKIVLSQKDWIPYNIEGMSKPNGSQKVYNFSDPDWAIVSQQLSTLYKKIRENHEAIKKSR